MVNPARAWFLCLDYDFSGATRHPPGHHQPPLTLVVTNHTQLRAVTGEKAGEREFWLTDTQDLCIIGLELLTHCGACVDVSGAVITRGTDTVVLQFGREKNDGPEGQ